MKNTELTNRKVSFFNKIKSFFTLKFRKNKEDSYRKIIREDSKDNKDSKKDENIDLEKEKKRLLKIYDDLKNDKMNVYQIPSEDLKIIEEVMKKEIEIKERKLNQVQTDINISKTNIKFYNDKLRKLKSEN